MFKPWAGLEGEDVLPPTAPVDHGLHLTTFGSKRVITHLQVFNPIQLKSCPALSTALILPKAPQSQPSSPLPWHPDGAIAMSAGASWCFLAGGFCA